MTSHQPRRYRRSGEFYPGGWAYLICAEEPLGNSTNPRAQAKHYLGSTDNIPQRMIAHRAGRGAKIMAAFKVQGIPWEVVRVWPGGWDKEQELKARHEGPTLCPDCSGKPRDKELLAQAWADTSEHDLLLTEAPEPADSAWVMPELEAG
jgi:hypothetical protein